MAGPWAADSSGHHRRATYELKTAYFLEGPQSAEFCTDGETNRAVHFAGGRMLAPLPELTDHYSLTFQAWNGMPTDAREISGWMYSRGHQDVAGTADEHLGIGGTAHGAGRLVYSNGTKVTAGTTEIPRWTWVSVALVRDGEKVQVYLNGKLEIDTTTMAGGAGPPLFFGGRCDNSSNWEGRLDEIAVFDRSLTADDVQRLATGGQ
jgi:hypothetical protein